MPGFDGTDRQWGEYAERFAQVCAATAAHYGDRIAAYQIWNEPDLIQPSPGYDPRVPDANFSYLLRRAANAITGERLLIVGGSVSGSPNYLEGVDSWDGILDAYDAIGVHPYGRRPEPDWPRPDWGFGMLGDLLAQYGTLGRPIWVTEMGVKENEAGSREMQAEFLTRTFQAAAATSAALFWFCWSDGMVPSFGLMDSNGVAKASYQSYADSAPDEPDPPPTKRMKVPAYWLSVLDAALEQYQLTEHRGLAASIWLRESNWHPFALGDWGSDGQPHAFGIGQVNDNYWFQRGTWKMSMVGKMDPERAAYESIRVLKWCAGEFPGDPYKITACYVDGPGESRWTEKTRNYADFVMEWKDAELVPLP